MPNRIIKESAFTSDRIAALSDFEFRLWIGLITQADDYGCGDARPKIIKGRVFALRDRVSITDIDNALHALAAAGCVSLYEIGGMPYFRFPSWAKHQRVRDAKPKFPLPDHGGQNGTSAASRGESPQVAASRGLNPIQSNPNPNPNPNPNTHVDAGVCVEEENEGCFSGEFAELWYKYPKKQGKNVAWRAFLRDRQEGIAYEAILRGVEAYAAYVRTCGISVRYVKTGGVFFESRAWEDDWSAAPTPDKTGSADAAYSERISKWRQENSERIAKWRETKNAKQV